ncbi:hypothetical protein [Halopiger djelfimassiliensis]|uniref:hypothetical protein n=1 Tax=Halopiger djelfimassiliensis TaxID=1293047 RepID=UPI000A6F0633|nr:hypothetical protein [Halopiger djelfimassiliensis]
MDTALQLVQRDLFEDLAAVERRGDEDEAARIRERLDEFRANPQAFAGGQR